MSMLAKAKTASRAFDIPPDGSVRIFATIERFIQVLHDVVHWSESRCPRENEHPEVCPLCGASIENLQGCKAADQTFPPKLLADIRSVLR